MNNGSDHRSMAKCSFCRSELPPDSVKSGSKRPTGGVGEIKCEKCERNEAKYGKPNVCMYCQLPAAFLGGKCVHCSYSERKHGAPQTCSNCKLKAAFPKDPSLKHKQLLCRLCLMTYKRSVIKASAKEKRKLSDTVVANPKEQESKRFKSSSFFDNGSNDPSGEQVLVIQQLKDEIVGLQKQLAQKDIVILERDKKIASLNAEAMRTEKAHRAKVVEMQKDSHETQELLQEKIRSLNKQVSQLARGKRGVVSNGNNSPSLSSATSS